jgi:hypothetical protein
VIHVKDYKVGLSSYKLNNNHKFRGTPWGVAEHWLFLDDSSKVGSLEWVCALFGVDKNRVRTNINPAWRKIYAKAKTPSLEAIKVVKTQPVGTEAESERALPQFAHAEAVAKGDIPTFVRQQART